MKILDNIIVKVKKSRCKIFGHRPTGMLTFQGNHISCKCSRCEEQISVLVEKKEVIINDNIM